ncbi:MAG: hypothetical protein ACUVTU_11285 [Desulfurispora sp.]|uniref:hypothetical protein n=1 Tax=Desulfurispora sp. TaxID=3014275 RepID=UPI00404AFB02
MEVVHSRHFSLRKELRHIPDGLAEMILNNADSYYIDVMTEYHIAVKRLEFNGAIRDMALTYSISEDKIILVTLHPLKEGQKENRVRSGRWVKNEGLL